jgi:hypothetical protein
MNPPIVYDKAKYHSESIETAGLPEGQEFVHTGFYLGWLIQNDLLDDEFVDDCLLDEIAAFKARKITGPEIYSRCDGALVDDMLSDEGNAFSQHYFNFEKGQFVADYMHAFSVSGGNDFFGVEDTWENFDRISQYFDRGYTKWKRTKDKKPWQFWK